MKAELFNNDGLVSIELRPDDDIEACKLDHLIRPHGTATRLLLTSPTNIGTYTVFLAPRVTSAMVRDSLLVAALEAARHANENGSAPHLEAAARAYEAATLLPLGDDKTL